MSKNRKEKKSLYNSIKKQILFFCTTMIILSLFYCFCINRLNRRFEIVEDDFSWVLQIDNIEENNKKIEITGWAFLLGQDAKKGNYEIILYDLSKSKGYYPKMQYEERKDIRKYFECENDYGECGFFAQMPANSIDLEDNVFEILIRPQGSKYAFSTSTFYLNGEMYFTNPKNFVELDVVGTDLENVVKDGILRVYRPDVGMYVYQYDGELYWIAENFYDFEKDASFIQYQLDTTQTDRLPKERIKNLWFWDNNSFYFESKEMILHNLEKYRVAKCVLPTEYSITRIWTGCCTDQWIWRSDFRPLYDFSE